MSQKVCFEDLPNELILHVASFLPAIDFVRFTLTCRRIFHLFDDNPLEWKRLLSRDLGEPCLKTKLMAEKVLQSGMATTRNDWKLLYMMQKKTLMNWARYNYKKFDCKHKGDLVFHTNGSMLSSFVYFDDPPNANVDPEKSELTLAIHWFDEQTHSWRTGSVVFPKQRGVVGLVKVEDVKCDSQRAVIKVSTSVSHNRLLVCFEFATSKAKWCGLASYHPIVNPLDSDFVFLYSSKYVIVGRRNTLVVVLMMDALTGVLLQKYVLYDYILGLFLQYCPHQNWLVFAIVPIHGFKPSVLALDLTGKEKLKRLELSGDPFLWSYPLAILESQMVLCESNSFSVWSLDSYTCQHYIQLDHFYSFVTLLLLKSKSEVDMLVGAWLNPYPDGHALHVIRVQGTGATILYSMDRGIIEPSSFMISIIGTQPIILSKSLKKEEGNEEKVLLMIGEKDSKFKQYSLPLDFSVVKYMSGAHIGINVNGSFVFLDFLQSESYNLNKKIA